MIEKMEVTYLANSSKNIYYMLLGDCVAADSPSIKMDKDIILSNLEIKVFNPYFPSKAINSFQAEVFLHFLEKLEEASNEGNYLIIAGEKGELSLWKLPENMIYNIKNVLNEMREMYINLLMESKPKDGIDSYKIFIIFSLAYELDYRLDELNRR